MIEAGWRYNKTKGWAHLGKNKDLEIEERFGRSPSAVSQKARNFGLQHTYRQDEPFVDPIPPWLRNVDADGDVEMR